MKIVLISCVSQKQDHKCKAQDLYTSALFKYNLQYARLLNPDKIFILSAKYGLLELKSVIEPYNLSLNNFRVNKLKEWSNTVISQLEKVTDLQNDNFIFLAGKKYRKYLIENLNNYEIPMEGLTIGRQLQFLKSKVLKNNKCNVEDYYF